VGKNAEMVALENEMVANCPYPLDVALERFHTGDQERYGLLLHYGQEPVTADLEGWFTFYNGRQTIEAGVKEGKEEGYVPMDTIFQPGIANIVDLSRLESGPRGRRNLTISVIARNLFRARADARLREEFGLASPLPRIWLAIDEAHQFMPAGGTTLSKEQLVRWAKEGRQPGLSLIVASQQPSAIDREVLSQCDVILSHKLTTRDDVNALNRLSQDYMGSELQALIRKLKRVGEAILVDDERETVHHLSIRPRRSRHGGSSIAPAEEERLDLWNE